MVLNMILSPSGSSATDRMSLWSHSVCSYTLKTHGNSNEYKSHFLRQSLVGSPLHLNHCVLARLQSKSVLLPGSNLHKDSKENRWFIRKPFPGSGSEKYWSVLKAPADKLWYYEHSALGQKLPLFLITWFEQEPAFRICPITQQPSIFPTAAAKNFPDLCSMFHLQGRLVNEWHCQAAFHVILFKLLFFFPI